MLRPDIVFNIVAWVGNCVAWSYTGNIGMMVMSMLGLLGAVVLGRLYAD